jgi:hypothetical protein
MRKIALVLALAGVFLMLRVNNALAIEKALIGTAKIYQERNGKDCNFFNSCVWLEKICILILLAIAYSNGTPFPDGEKVTIYLNNSDSPLVVAHLRCMLKCKTTLLQQSFQEIKSNQIVHINSMLHCLIMIMGLESTKASRKTYTQSPVASIQCGDDENQCMKT